MADEQKKASAGESFAGSVLKFSVATYLGFIISGVAIVVQGILGPEKTGLPAQFMNTTATLMYLGILGLDQALLRFYHEPPAGCTGRGLFSACTRLSVAFMAVLGVGGSVLFGSAIARATGFASVGRAIVPLLFLNAGMYMLVRYLNVLLRLENNIRAYTAETLWMQACYNLLYLLPGFFTSNVYVFALAAVFSFGLVAIAFGFKVRGGSRISLRQSLPVYRTVVPYGLALAPSQVLVYLNSTVSSSFLLNYTDPTTQGVYAFSLRVANLVTAIQAGFSTFWGPYVYAHYREEQSRICRVHDVLNLLIFGFFCVLVMLEDVLFLLFPAYREGMAVFPLLMLSVVFNILCEGTVYGNSIARKPYHDTIGIGVGAAANAVLCALLVPAFGLKGAALSLAVSSGAMFLYRTVTGQYYYRTIPSYSKTAAGFLLAFAVTGIGCLLWQHFALKFLLTGAALFIYCVLYLDELLKLWRLGTGILKRVLRKS
ncbi:MAG: polysaccharide biosynthesis C-terminal domain-containing protein [Gemmiger sp.]